MKVVGSKFYIEHDGEEYIVDQYDGRAIVFHVTKEGPWLALHAMHNQKTIMTPNMAVAAVMKALEVEAVSARSFSVNDGIPELA